MNALEIVLSADRPITLPMAYQQLIQGALYRLWGDTFPELHDEGYPAEGRVFRMFVFSALEGRYIRKGTSITFSGPLRLEVRSPVPALLEPLREGLTRERALWLGDKRLAVIGLFSRDCLLFPPCALIEMRTPLTLHRTLPDGFRRCYAPDEEEFPLLLAENLASKIQAAQLSIDPCVSLVPVAQTLTKRVARFRSTYVTGWTGRFRLEAEPETLAFLYYADLGVGGSRGFGMFDILRPVERTR